MNESFDVKAKRISVLKTYGENFQDKEYITNPAIGRDEQIKQLILILLTPDKSAVLLGKPGVGKTATVEGLAYRIQKGLVPDVLKGYQVIKVNTSALLGVDPVTGEAKVNTLLDELKEQTKLILFIDEIHTLMGTLPKIEKRTGAKMKYTPFIQRKMMEFITDITSEYKRVYEIGSRYPDVSLTMVQEAFSNALFNNRFEVTALDFRNAIINSKNIYPDVIKKSLPIFDTTFAEQLAEINRPPEGVERLGNEYE